MSVLMLETLVNTVVEVVNANAWLHACDVLKSLITKVSCGGCCLSLLLLYVCHGYKGCHFLLALFKSLSTDVQLHKIAQLSTLLKHTCARFNSTSDRGSHVCSACAHTMT